MSHHPAAWIHLFLDTPAAEFDEAVEFWAAVTGCRPSDRRGEHGQFLTLQPTSGPPWLTMQAVDQPAGVHLDLDSTDRASSTDRALALGATTSWTYHDVEVMNSPGGLTFCQTLLDGDPSLQRDGSTILDQVCLDIPSDAWEVEVAFWRDLTGRDLEQGLRPEFAFLGDEGRPRILLQRLDDTGGTVRAHPDLASADRTSDVRRHLGLGAVVLDEHDRWTVLTAPAGQVYCLTDRDPTTGVVTFHGGADTQ